MRRTRERLHVGAAARFRPSALPTEARLLPAQVSRQADEVDQGALDDAHGGEAAALGEGVGRVVGGGEGEGGGEAAGAERSSSRARVAAAAVDGARPGGAGRAAGGGEGVGGAAGGPAGVRERGG